MILNKKYFLGYVEVERVIFNFFFKKTFKTL